MADDSYFGTADYQNQLFLTTPNIPGVDDSLVQPRSVELYSGSVGATISKSPNDGINFLVQSAFGFPVAPTPSADFIKFGAIIPAPVGVDPAVVPTWSPIGKLFYVAENYSLYAADPGFVTATWTLKDGSVASKAFFVSSDPVTAPVSLFHTHPSGINFTNNPAVPSDLIVRRVVLPSQAGIEWKWNTAIPYDSSNPAVTNNPLTGELLAHNATGLICAVIRQSEQFQGVELISVRPYDYVLQSSPVDIGSRLLPYTEYTNSVAIVTLGQNQADTSLSFVYQHVVEGSAQKGAVFAVKKSVAPDGSDIEILWRRQSFGSIDWPYEAHRYLANWPKSGYQVYVRDNGPVNGPDVVFSSGLGADLMPYFESIGTGHFSVSMNPTLVSTGAGWSLLRYRPADRSVRFKVVRSTLHSDSAELGSLAASNWAIGAEVTNPAHQGPRPGYIHVPEGNRYDWETYDGASGLGSDWQTNWTTKQIFAVNTGTIEVWWSTLDSDGVQWPSFVRRYTAVWPDSPEHIVIASTVGSGGIDENVYRNLRLYVQNDPNRAGFNPNDEHAVILTANSLDGQSASGRAVFALRDDLGSDATSLPYTLLKFRDGQDRWQFRVFQVSAEDGVYHLQYPATAGKLLQPPYPLSILQLSPKSYGYSGPYFQDRKQSFWARAAGTDDAATNIVLKFYYPIQDGFYFPPPSFASFPPGVDATNLPPPGTFMPWLNRRQDPVSTVPTDVTYVINWPTNYSTLSVGETLVSPKKGLPSIAQQTSVEVLFDQGTVRDGTSLVQLIDPTRERVVTNVDLSSAADLAIFNDKGVARFVNLPPQLRSRIGYVPLDHTLHFLGQNEVPALGEPYLLLNTLSKRDSEMLLALSHSPSWRNAVAQLVKQSSSPIAVPPNTPFDSLALTAGNAQAQGWVTVGFGTSTNLSRTDEPVSVSVFRVGCPRFVGETKVIEPDSPLDEKITLRHSGDFAGRPDQYQFEWRTLPPDTQGGLPSLPPEQWNSFTPKVASGFTPGQGAVDITIEGAGLFTLSDNWFVCRYRPIVPDGVCSEWSGWAAPGFAPGWIKRALQGINPFEQRVNDYTNHGVSTLVSMISQAGTRYRGDIPFNKDALNEFGLIEIYESILKRGIGFSIEGVPPVNYGPANDALLLAAGRISDLYMLLGNEAYADASDPTIGFSTDGQVGAEATSLHCFMNQTASLMEEELDLLRGRDDHNLPAVTTFPAYNRLIWNFVEAQGEAAYVQNYDIRDQNQDGTINELDARIQYPQGHGDAWGHYLSAIKGYYKLLRSPNFAWVPRAETILIGGAPVTVDYFDERKFATAAAAKANTGSEVVTLTYRQFFAEDADAQARGFEDATADRAWGVADWGVRAGMGAFFDWVTANAILPSTSTNVGVQKIDRTTVIEIPQIAASADAIQAEVDKADEGLNPLGLARNVVPFGIDPSQVINPQGGVAKTHFEQIYDRAVASMNNAIASFNHAANSSQLLRKQADSLNDFQKNFQDKEADMNSRLIESFGYPYSDDIGAGKTYEQGYSGPDLYHYMYSDPSVLLGDTNYSTQQFTIQVSDVNSSVHGELTTSARTIVYNVSPGVYGLVKPPTWMGQRQAPGEIQRTHGDLMQANGRFQRAQVDYDNLLAQIDGQAALLRSQYAQNADEIYLLDQAKNTQQTLNEAIQQSRQNQLNFQAKGRMATLVANALSEALPHEAGVIAGLAAGIIIDPSFGIRGGIQLAGNAISEISTREANSESLVELSEQQAKEAVSAANNIQLTALRQDGAINQQLQQLAQLIRQEASLRVELYTAQESVVQAAGSYQAALARAQRLLDDRNRLRTEAAAEVQTRRYNDMTFRIFRNEALQKYRAQFDMAAMYVYLAAKAYDFETNLRTDDAAYPGQGIMHQIVQARTIGLITGGQPQTGAVGDSGLADPMARMTANFEQVLRFQLGLNNPQFAKRDFSLRSEFFRIVPTNGPAAAGQVWRDTLAKLIVPNLGDVTEFRRNALFQGTQSKEPGLVIPFSTIIDSDLNFFGWPAGAGDSTYDPFAFSTKIRSVGVSFSNYKISGAAGLKQNAFVYLIPVGSDVMRSPRRTAADDLNYTRSWQVEDQWLPTPFKLSDKSDPKLALDSYIPIYNLQGANQVGDARALAPLQAWNDALNVSRDDPQFQDTQLVGRSVWNTRWLLVIPASSLLSDRNDGLQRFMYGGLVNGSRNNDGITDIRIQIQSYSYTGR